MFALWEPLCFLARLKIVKHFTLKNMFDNAEYIFLSISVIFLEMEEIYIV